MLTEDKKIRIAQKDPVLSCCETKEDVYMLPSMANRHGLIAGATGTGKTTTMKVLAESFSDLGVPVFFADVKGDLSGTAFPGVWSEKMQKRAEEMGLVPEFEYKAYPCRFWDIFGETGHVVRVTVSALGPVLLSRLLGLTEVQQGVLNIVFRVADEHGLELLDLKDLRSMLTYIGENANEYTLSYGKIASSSVGAILRALLAFENEGGECMFGEPMLDIRDWIRTSPNGRGYINILESKRLVQNPLTYSTFLLWMLTEVYEILPEIGDPEKPRLVFFFDEAHMLFSDAPKALIQKTEQVIKLVRSKGVGVYFVTQSPSDIPDGVLAQLNNRIIHGLRAYTPAEQKNLKAAASSFRVNPAFKTEEKLMELGTGDALVSLLDENGVPSEVQAVRIYPPQSFMGPAEPEEIKKMILSDEFEIKYRASVDRESAFEILEQARTKMLLDEADMEDDRLEGSEEARSDKAEAKGAEGTVRSRDADENHKKEGPGSKARMTAAERAAGNAASSVARSVSSNIVNSLTGGKTKSASQIARQAANAALSAVVSSKARAIVRGLFGNKRR